MFGVALGGEAFDDARPAAGKALRDPRRVGAEAFEMPMLERHPRAVLASFEDQLEFRLDRRVETPAPSLKHGVNGSLHEGREHDSEDDLDMQRPGRSNGRASMAQGSELGLTSGSAEGRL